MIKDQRIADVVRMIEVAELSELVEIYNGMVAVNFGVRRSIGMIIDNKKRTNPRIALDFLFKNEVLFKYATEFLRKCSFNGLLNALELIDIELISCFNSFLNAARQ